MLTSLRRLLITLSLTLGIGIGVLADEPPAGSRTVGELVAKLNSATSTTERREVVRELGSTSDNEAAANAVLDWIADPEIGKDARSALRSMGSVVLPRVAQQLTVSDSATRVAALQVIGSFFRYGRSVQSAVAAALHDSDESVQRAALYTLGDINPSDPTIAPRIAAFLKHENSEVRRGAAITLGEMGPAGRSAVSALADALHGEPTLVRVPAAQALASMGSDALPAIAALSQAMSDEDPGMRKAVAAAIANTWIDPGGEAFSEPLPTLRDALESNEPRRRITALHSCLQLPGAVTLNTLLRPVDACLSHQSPQVVEAALQVIGKHQPHDSDIAETVFRLAGHTDAIVRAETFTTISKMKRTREGIKAVVMTGLMQADDATRAAAARAAAAHCKGDLEVIALLVNILEREQRGREAEAFRTAIIESLGAIGPEAIDSLLVLLLSENVEARFSAAQGLGQAGTSAKLALPALVKLLQEQSTRSYRVGQVLRAIEQIGIGSDDVAFKSIGGLLDSEYAFLRVRAAEVLLTADRALWLPLVQRIANNLEEESEEKVIRNIRTLAQMGPAAKAAVANLEQVIAGAEKYSLYPLAAMRAIWQIEGASDALTKRVAAEAVRPGGQTSDAVELLADMGRAAESEYEQVMDVLTKSDDHHSHLAAARFLGQYPRHADRSLPALRTAIEVAPPWAIVDLAEAMRSLGASRSELEPYLLSVSYYYHADESLKHSAVSLLRSFPH